MRLCAGISSSCELCQESKFSTHRTEDERNLESPNGANKMVSLAIFGPLSMAENGQKHIISTLDMFSKFKSFIKIQGIMVATIIKAIKRWLRRPENGSTIILTD